MIRTYKDKYVPRVLGFYLEYIPNLGIYRLTRNPHIATSLSTKAKARAVRREFYSWIFLRK